jgi:hypothetical protein
MSDTPRTDAGWKRVEESVAAHCGWDSYHPTIMRDVAAELERELAEATSRISDSQKWVPVAERLPEIGDTVLAYWTPNPHAVTNIRSWGITTFQSWGWVGVDDPDDHYGIPTHWMPLPEAPK